MAKFPSQRTISYESGSLSNDAWSTFGYMNAPKDLSILNRRGYASTTRKGVPLVYRIMFKLYSQNFAGKQVAKDSANDGSVSEDTDAETAGASDFSTTLSVIGCQNNWVMKNAAVKIHAAREKLFREAGVRKKDRGAWSHEIRYGFDTNNQTWLSPLDGAGAAFTGGTWDVSTISTQDDSNLQLKLVGTGHDEEAGVLTGTSVSIAHTYLMSRNSVPEDTNPEMDETPAKYSLLRRILENNSDDMNDDDTIAYAKVEQDAPPYELIDISDSGDVDHDVTEPVELGRAVAGLGVAIGSVVCDVPFGLAQLKARHSGAADQNIIDPVYCTAEVLGIYEMQG